MHVSVWADKPKQRCGNCLLIFQPDRFCGEDEEHDPSDEFEEYLACAVCGDNGKLLVLLTASYRQ